MIDKYNGVSSENVLPTLPCLMLLLFAVGCLGKIRKIFKHQSNFFPASIFSHASANHQLETFRNQTQIWHRCRTGAPTVVVVESLQRFSQGALHYSICSISAVLNQDLCYFLGSYNNYLQHFIHILDNQAQTEGSLFFKFKQFRVFSAQN